MLLYAVINVISVSILSLLWRKWTRGSKIALTCLEAVSCLSLWSSLQLGLRREIQHSTNTGKDRHTYYCVGYAVTDKVLGVAFVYTPSARVLHAMLMLGYSQISMMTITRSTVFHHATIKFSLRLLKRLREWPTKSVSHRTIAQLAGITFQCCTLSEWVSNCGLHSVTIISLSFLLCSYTVRNK